MSIFSWNFSNTFTNLWHYVVGCQDDFFCKLTSDRLRTPEWILSKARTLAAWTGIPPSVSVPAGAVILTGMAGYSLYHLATYKDALAYMQNELKKKLGEPIYNVIVGPFLKAIEDATRDYKNKKDAEKPLPPGASHDDKAKRQKEARDKAIAKARENFDKILKSNREDIKKLVENRKRLINMGRAKSTSESTAVETPDNFESDMRNYFYTKLYVEPQVQQELTRTVSKLK